MFVNYLIFFKNQNNEWINHLSLKMPDILHQHLFHI